MAHRYGMAVDRFDGGVNVAPLTPLRFRLESAVLELKRPTHKKASSMQSTPSFTLNGRILMTMATLMYGLIPPFVDLTETHVFHPDWTPHSRMHMVWLLGTNSTLAMVALYFLWLYKENRSFGVSLAGVLGLCVYGGFMLSAATTTMYGGSLSDKGGVPPILGLDANILGFSTALLILLIGWFLARAKNV